MLDSTVYDSLISIAQDPNHLPQGGLIPLNTYHIRARICATAQTAVSIVLFTW